MLEEIGNALSWPRRALFESLGLPTSGAELLHQTIGLDPESALGKTLGFGTEMATDPLTYLGGAAARGVRALLPGGSKLLGLGKAAATGDGLASQAFRQELAAVPVLRRAEMVAENLPGSVERSGGRAMLVGSPTAEGHNFVAEVARGRHLPDDQLVGLGSRLGEAREVVGAGNFHAAFPDGQAAVALEDATADLPSHLRDSTMQELTGLSGANEYQRMVARHESTHAIINQARQQGTQSQLPLLLRGPASLPGLDDQGASALSRGLGLAAEETAAHALEHRSPLGQLAGGMGFLFSPGATHQGYAAQLGRVSPLVGRAYGALPGAFVNSGYAAGAGGGRLAAALGE